MADSLFTPEETRTFRDHAAVAAARAGSLNRGGAGSTDVIVLCTRDRVWKISGKLYDSNGRT